MPEIVNRWFVLAHSFRDLIHDLLTFLFWGLWFVAPHRREWIGEQNYSLHDQKMKERKSKGTGFHNGLCRDVFIALKTFLWAPLLKAPSPPVSSPWGASLSHMNLWGTAKIQTQAVLLYFSNSGEFIC
jgi:hypothetical protein